MVPCACLQNDIVVGVCVPSFISERENLSRKTVVLYTRDHWCMCKACNFAEIFYILFFHLKKDLFTDRLVTLKLIS